jgi:hypothetical protein
MALSDVGVCNRALLRIGLAPIASLSEGSDRATTCQSLYEDTKMGCLSMYDWRFTLRKVQLARLVTAPVNAWRYAYQLPTNRISGPRAIYNSTSVGVQPILGGFEIFGAQVFTDETVLVADYQENVAEADWPPYFTPLVVYAMAAALAPTLTDREDLTVEYHARAWGTPQESFRGGWFAQAAMRDSFSNPAGAFDTSEFVNARFS